MDLNDLYYFAQVVEHGGFTAAARALGLQKSLLSRRILALEERLQVRLLQRSSRSFSVTEIGHEFYTRCAAMMEEARAAEQVVAENQALPRGIVRLSCPVGLLDFQFGPLLARFMAANPAVTLHVESTNRQVDVIADGIDMAIRVRFPPLEETDLVMRRLDDSSQCLVAHPAVVPAPLDEPAGLAALPSLGSTHPRSRHQWELHDGAGRVETVSHQPRLVTDDMNALREAALAGQGVVQLPTLFIYEDCRAGRLVRVVPHWRPRNGIVHAVFPSRRGLLPSVRALLDFLARECAARRASMGNFS